MFFQLLEHNFLFNTLNTISSFCRTNPLRARELIIDLSNYFRKSLNKGEFVGLNEEVEMLKSYISIEKARYGDRLSVYFYIQKDIEHFKIPSFIIQPIIENSIIHGVLKKERADVIFVDINIPVLNGMELAKMIKEFDENIAIIFVTAYDKYAISAFELMALDYILKPFDEDRIEKTIQRLRKYMKLKKNNINNIENEIEQIIKKYDKSNISNINKIPCINNEKIHNHCSYCGIICWRILLL